MRDNCGTRAAGLLPERVNTMTRHGQSPRRDEYRQDDRDHRRTDTVKQWDKLIGEPDHRPGSPIKKRLAGWGSNAYNQHTTQRPTLDGLSLPALDDACVATV